MNKNDLIVIREYKPEDKNFILATFLRGLYYGDSWFALIPKNIFMAQYHGVAEYLLAKPTTKIFVACLKEDPQDPKDQEVIVGYSLVDSQTNALHWVFVKKSWRLIGIAKSLIPANIKTVTHLSKVGLNIMRKHSDVVFNPFLV